MLYKNTKRHWIDTPKFQGHGHKGQSIKDTFLRGLREVAPEMELFLENHGQSIKKSMIKLIYIQSCTFRHFTKKIVS